MAGRVGQFRSVVRGGGRPPRSAPASDAARNDQDKRAIFEALGFPLLRIGTRALERVDGTRPVLAWLVDRWFAERDAAGRPRPARLGPMGGDLGPFAADYATVHSAYAANALADGGPDVHRFVRQARYAEVVVVARRARGGRVFGRARVREFGVFAGLAAADLAEMFAWRQLAAALAVGLPPDPASERALDRLLARPANA